MVVVLGCAYPNIKSLGYPDGAPITYIYISGHPIYIHLMNDNKYYPRKGCQMDKYV